MSNAVVRHNFGPTVLHGVSVIAYYSGEIDSLGRPHGEGRMESTHRSLIAEGRWGEGQLRRGHQWITMTSEPQTSDKGEEGAQSVTREFLCSGEFDEQGLLHCEDGIRREMVSIPIPLAATHSSTEAAVASSSSVSAASAASTPLLSDPSLPSSPTSSSSSVCLPRRVEIFRSGVWEHGSHRSGVLHDAGGTHYRGTFDAQGREDGEGTRRWGHIRWEKLDGEEEGRGEKEEEEPDASRVAAAEEAIASITSPTPTPAESPATFSRVLSLPPPFPSSSASASSSSSAASLPPPSARPLWTGLFRSGERCGPGIEYLRDGTVLRTGEWSSDIKVHDGPISTKWIQNLHFISDKAKGADLFYANGDYKVNATGCTYDRNDRLKSKDFFCAIKGWIGIGSCKADDGKKEEEADKEKQQHVVVKEGRSHCSIFGWF